MIDSIRTKLAKSVGLVKYPTSNGLPALVLQYALNFNRCVLACKLETGGITAIACVAGATPVANKYNLFGADPGAIPPVVT